jgi:hypothetical protein
MDLLWGNMKEDQSPINRGWDVEERTKNPGPLKKLDRLLFCPSSLEELPDTSQERLGDVWFRNRWI